MVEFAFVAPVLLGLLCGVFEFSGILFAQTLLEGGARQASRYGITGSSTAEISREQMILQIIEDNAYGVIDTDHIDMETLVYESFADVGQPDRSPMRTATGTSMKAKSSLTSTAMAAGMKIWASQGWEDPATW